MSATRTSKPACVLNDADFRMADRISAGSVVQSCAVRLRCRGLPGPGKYQGRRRQGQSQTGKTQRLGCVRCAREGKPFLAQESDRHITKNIVAIRFKWNFVGLLTSLCQKYRVWRQPCKRGRMPTWSIERYRGARSMCWPCLAVAVFSTPTPDSSARPNQTRWRIRICSASITCRRRSIPPARRFRRAWKQGAPSSRAGSARIPCRLAAEASAGARTRCGFDARRREPCSVIQLPCSASTAGWPGVVFGAFSASAPVGMVRLRPCVLAR